MKAVCIIPARYQSTRLPGKPLLDIAGKPMIQWVVERANKAKRISEVIVATDDDRILHVVQSFGGTAVLTSREHRCGTERLAEVASKMPEVDIVVNVQGDEPLIEAESIDALVSVFDEAKKPEMATAMSRMEEADYTNPAAVKVVTAINGDALYFSRACIPYLRTVTGLGIWKHIGIYAYQKEFLLRFAQWPQTPLEQAESLEQLRVLEMGYCIRVVKTDHAGRGVDTPDDLDVVRHILSGMQRRR